MDLNFHNVYLPSYICWNTCNFSDGSQGNPGKSPKKKKWIFLRGNTLNKLQGFSSAMFMFEMLRVVFVHGNEDEHLKFTSYVTMLQPSVQLLTNVTIPSKQEVYYMPICHLNKQMCCWLARGCIEWSIPLKAEKHTRTHTHTPEKQWINGPFREVAWENRFPPTFWSNSITVTTLQLLHHPWINPHFWALQQVPTVATHCTAGLPAVVELFAFNYVGPVGVPRFMEPLWLEDSSRPMSQSPSKIRVLMGGL